MKIWGVGLGRTDEGLPISLIQMFYGKLRLSGRASLDDGEYIEQRETVLAGAPSTKADSEVPIRNAKEVDEAGALGMRFGIIPKP